MQKSGLLEALPIQTTIVWYFSQWLFNGSLSESLYNNHKVSNLIFGVSILACKRLLILDTIE